MIVGLLTDNEKIRNKLNELFFSLDFKVISLNDYIKVRMKDIVKDKISEVRLRGYSISKRYWVNLLLSELQTKEQNLKEQNIFINDVFIEDVVDIMTVFKCVDKNCVEIDHVNNKNIYNLYIEDNELKSEYLTLINNIVNCSNVV